LPAAVDMASFVVSLTSAFKPPIGGQQELDVQECDATKHHNR